MAFIPAPHAAARPDRKQITISSNTTNYNLASDLTNNHGWDGVSPIDAQVTINPGVSVSATATTAPAFHADLVSGSTLTLDNHGVIVGKGGSAGSAGGHAISLQDVDATINNIPQRNLSVRSEAFTSGSWAKTGSPTVTAYVSSKNLYTNSEAADLAPTKNSVTVTPDQIAKPTVGNILPHPQDIDQWTDSSNVDVIPNDLVAPDGSHSADSIQRSLSATSVWAGRASIVGAVETAEVYTVSGYFKQDAPGANYPLMNFINAASPYENRAQVLMLFQSGTLTLSHWGGTAKVGNPVFTDSGNGWWRVSFQVLTSSTASDYYVTVMPNANQTGTDPVGVWGVQVEKGELTDYVPAPRNLFFSPEAFDAPSWTTGGTTVTPNDKVGPFGGQVADKVATTNTGTYKYITQVANIPGGNLNHTYRQSIGGKTITTSVWVYADTTFDFVIRTRADAAPHDAINTTVSTVAGQWTRVSQTRSFHKQTSGDKVHVFFYTDHAVSGQSHYWLYGAQIEAGARLRNMVRNSEDFSVSPWFGNGIVTTDQVANPVNGAQTADLVARSASDGKRLQVETLVVSGSTYIHSAYLKNVSVGTTGSNNGVTRMMLHESVNGYANMIYITWTNGVPAVTYNANFGGFSPSGGSAIEDVGSGWYRISYTAVANNGNNLTIGFECSTVGSESLYVWGMQLEKNDLSVYQQAGDTEPAIVSALTDYEPYKNHNVERTADLILEQGGVDGHRFGQGITPNQTGVVHTASVYLKAAGRHFAYMREGFDSDPGYKHTAIDLRDGSITQDSHGTAAVENVGDGWFRLSMTFTPNSGSDIYIGMNHTEITNDTFVSYAGDKSKGIYVWGAQVEQGSVLSAHEPTGATKNPPIANPVNGSQTVALVTRTTTAETHLRSGGSTTKPAIAQTYTISCYARRSIGDYFALRFNEGGSARSDATFNLRTGKVHSTSKTTYTNAEANIESVGGDWYRCSLTTLSLTGTTAQLQMSFNSNGGDVDDTDTALSAGYIWGAQIEATSKNILPHPQAIDQWTNVSNDTGVLVDSMAAPDGSMTMDQVRRNIGSSNPWARRSSIAGVAEVDTLYTVSGYFKAPTATNTNKVFVTFIQNNLQRAEIAFTFSNGTPTLNAYSYGGKTSNAPILRDVGNGFWRVSFEVISLASGAGSTGYYINIFPDGSTTGNDYMGVWGVQVEKGFLTEYVPETRNLFLSPENLIGSSWTNYNTTIAPDSLVAPDGTMTGDTIAQGLGSTYPQNDGVRNIPANLLPSTIYTCSAYFHCSSTNHTGVYIANYANSPAEVAKIFLNWSGGSPSFESSAGVSQYTLRDVGSGWWRLCFTFTTHSNASQSNQFYFYANRNVPNSDPVGIWGVQLEVGAKNLVEQPERFDSSYWGAVGGATRLNNPDSVNIVRQSEDFLAVGHWGNHGNFVKTADHAIAPDGTHTADLLTKTSAVGGWIGQSFGANRTGATTFTWSCFAKKSVGDYFTLRTQAPYPDRMDATFNINTGAVHSTSVTNFTNISASITNVGDGWYRCSVTGTTPSSTGFVYTNSYVSCNSNGVTLSDYDSVSNSAVLVWGAQLQYGSTLSEYEPTGSTANPKILAPNGTETANLLTAGSGSYGGLTLRKYLPTSDIEVSYEHTLSVYVKKINHRYIHLRHPSSLAVGFDFDTLSFIGGASATSKTVEDVGDGWYRISVSFTQPSGANTNAILDLALADSSGASSSASVSGGEAFYAWGLQFEHGPLTPYEEASNYIAVGNKATRYQPFDQGVSASFGGGGYNDRSPHILGGGGGGGYGGSVTGNNSQEETSETGGCTTGSSHSGGSGGAGAGPGAAVAGSSGSSPAGSGGAGGTYGAAGSSGSGGAGTAIDNQCASQVSNGAGGAGGAAGKAIHLVSGATLTLRNAGEILGATS